MATASAPRTNRYGLTTDSTWNETTVRRLDRNGDQSGELRLYAFNRLDLDRRLSGRVWRRTIDVIVVPAPGPTVVVEAWERWMDTGIDVQARDLLLFEASGTIQVGDDAPAMLRRRTARRGAIGALMCRC